MEWRGGPLDGTVIRTPSGSQPNFVDLHTYDEDGLSIRRVPVVKEDGGTYLDYYAGVDV